MQGLQAKGYGGLADLCVVALAPRELGEYEVRVRVQAASVNDWDWCISQGQPFYIRLLCGLRRPKLPALGVDMAGVVEEIGSAVTAFNIGDRVYGDLSECGFGAFADIACVPESQLVLIPDNVSFEQAACIPHAGALALQALQQAGLRAGQSLIINGAGGGVGTLALQYAKHIQASTLGAVDHGHKASALLSLGFDYCIDYTTSDFTRACEPVDVIVDVKTNRSVFKYLKALKKGGTYITVGGTTPRLLQLLCTMPLIRWLTGKRVMILALKPNQGLDQLSKLLRDGVLTPVIDTVFPLEKGRDAMARFGSAKQFGKVIIKMGAAPEP